MRGVIPNFIHNPSSLSDWRWTDGG